MKHALLLTIFSALLPLSAAQAGSQLTERCRSESGACASSSVAAPFSAKLNGSSLTKSAPLGFAPAQAALIGSCAGGSDCGGLPNNGKPRPRPRK